MPILSKSPNEFSWIFKLETKALQRIVIGLFGEATPRLVENFTTLCRQNAYAGTTFYRVLSDYSIQGGAIGDASGKSGKSASGNALEPDNFDILHNKAGLVSMVRTNTGVGLVDSRFFITCANDAGWADDRYAAFGIVDEGSMNVVHDIEKVKVKPPQNSPTVPVQIVASGVLS
jgi:cyclophilin family peptidyl-prolyl cis-trans isomerase